MGRAAKIKGLITNENVLLDNHRVGLFVSVAYYITGNVGETHRQRQGRGDR